MLKSKGIRPVTYVGYTNNLKKRISLHNLGKGAKFTKGRKWKLIYMEKMKSKKEAISREYYRRIIKLRNKIKMNITILLPYKENFSPDIQVLFPYLFMKLKNK